MKPTIEECETRFAYFWKHYPARNGKKVGKKDCWQWWLKNKPDTETFAAMMEWLRIDNSNRAITPDFYAAPKDPFRWLRDRRWEQDEITEIKPAEVITTKTKLWPISGRSCGVSGCGMPAVYKKPGEYDHYYCTEHLPNKVKEFYC